MVNPFFPSETFSTPTQAVSFYIQSQNERKWSHDKNNETSAKTRKNGESRRVSGCFFQFRGNSKNNLGTQNGRSAGACRLRVSRNGASSGAYVRRASGERFSLEGISRGGNNFAIWYTK